MSGNEPTITAAILYDLVGCPHRVSLDAFGDPSRRDEINAFVELLWERGTLYERQVIADLAIPFVDLSAAPPADKERLTLEAMDRGESLILGGRISSDSLLGMPDLLRREGGGYVPGDIKSGNGEEDTTSDDESRPKLHYAVQLALYADILERLGRGRGHKGFIWDVRGQDVPYDLDAPQGPRKPESLWMEYQSLLGEARQILMGAVTTLPAYAANCKLCHWGSYCKAELVAADDLTLIPQLGRKIRDVMIGQIPTVRDLAEINPEGFAAGKKKTVFPGVGPDSLIKFQRRAALISTADAQGMLIAPINLTRRPRELFFDIEVDPLRDLCYLHGIVERRDNDNETERFVAFFTEDESPDAEKAAFADAFAYLTADPTAVIYYWSKYERTIYRKLRAKYPDVCTADDIEALFDPTNTIDLLYDVVTKATEWPTHDRSIKTIAKFLGFNWRDTHPSGAASIQWFDEWVKTRDPTVRQRILDYNEDDCRATRVVLDGILNLE